MLRLLFARRYLFSPKSRSVINLIAALSVVAVAMPVAAMIILLSVFNGFEQLIRGNYSVFDADLRITAREGQTFARDAIDTMQLRQLEGVEAFSGVLEQHVLLEANGAQATSMLRGVDDHYAEVVLLDRAMVAGTSAVRLGAIDRLLIGESTAYQLGIRSLVDPEVHLYAVRRGSFSTLVPMGNYTRRTVEVEGVFGTDYVTEGEYAITSLRLAESLLEREGRYSALLVRCRDECNIEAIQRRVAALIGDDFRVENRDEQRASFYRLVKYEKWGVFFIALLVLVIASFSVIGALSMLIIEKRDERMTLRAMGATQRFIRSIFRYEGYFICTIGALIGTVLGVALSLIQQYAGLIQIPATSFLPQSYPVELHVGDILLVLLTFAVVARVLSAVTVRSMLKNDSL